MKRSDFMLAGQQDREQYIVRPEKQIPLTMLVPGSESHLVSTKELTVSFLTMKAGSAALPQTEYGLRIMSLW